GGEPPLLPETDDATRARLAGPACDALYQAWWIGAETSTSAQRLQLIVLASASGRMEPLVIVGQALADDWLDGHRYRGTNDLLETILDIAGRPHGFLKDLARAKLVLGESETSGRLIKEAVTKCPPQPDSELTSLLLHYTDWLEQTGDFAEVERVCRDQLL